MVGNNCFAIASDLRNRLPGGVQAVRRPLRPRHRRPDADQWLVFKHKLYQLREERGMKPDTFTSLVSALYEKRFGPYFCQPIVAGLGEKDEPFICSMDCIGAKFGPYFCKPIIAGLGENDQPFICAMDCIGAKLLASFCSVGIACSSGCRCSVVGSCGCCC